jgi:DNA-binding CsgD family transcriptional regulator
MTELLAESDLRAVMTVVEDARRGEPTAGMPWTMWDGLTGLVRCDAVSFTECDVLNRRGIVWQLGTEGGERNLQVGDDDPPKPSQFWKYLGDFRPCGYAQRTGDLASVVRWSDFYTPTELCNAPLYAEFYRPDGIHHGMTATLPAPHGQMRKLSWWRGIGSDFSERDRLIIQLLRPHLWEIYFDGSRRRLSRPHLTNREWDVLRLVHAGLSNAEIARQLFISVATVRKHMEHIMQRTGAGNRMAAAARMIAHSAGYADHTLLEAALSRPLGD